MSLPDKLLQVKASTLPNAGKGLFIKTDVEKGAVITEYIGKRKTWAQVENDVDNGYIYYIDDDNVIDAAENKKTFGRYANDAAGFSKLSGTKNNAMYYESDGKVYIKATKKITAGSEIFVAYGKDYWKQININNKIDRSKKTK